MFIIHRKNGGLVVLKEVQGLTLDLPNNVTFRFSNGEYDKIKLQCKNSGLDLQSALIRGFNTNEEFKEVSDD